MLHQLSRTSQVRGLKCNSLLFALRSCCSRRNPFLKAPAMKRRFPFDRLLLFFGNAEFWKWIGSHLVCLSRGMRLRGGCRPNGQYLSQYVSLLLLVKHWHKHLLPLACAGEPGTGAFLGFQPYHSGVLGKVTSILVYKQFRHTSRSSRHWPHAHTNRSSQHMGNVRIQTETPRDERRTT